MVTGHTGFKGSWLTLLLANTGAEVSGLALDPPTDPSLFDLAQVGAVMANDFRGDIRDCGLLEQALEQSNPDVVIHLAAQPLVRAAYADPFGTFEVNVMGTTTVLESLRRRGRPVAVLVVTTDKVYADDGSSPAFHEEDRLGGHEPYSASKAAAEMVVEAYRRTYFPVERLSEHRVALATARSGNVIGGGDWSAHRLIPDFVRAAIAGQPLDVRSPFAVRPWQHVLSALDGYLLLAAELLGSTPEKACRAWNFGPASGQLESVFEVLKICTSSWPGTSWVATDDPAGPRETPQLRLDASLARDQLHWQDPWTTEESVRRTIEWYRRSVDHCDGIRQFCAEEINAWRTAAGRILQTLPARAEAAAV